MDPKAAHIIHLSCLQPCPLWRGQHPLVRRDFASRGKEETSQHVEKVGNGQITPPVIKGGREEEKGPRAFAHQIIMLRMLEAQLNALLMPVLQKLPALIFQMRQTTFPHGLAIQEVQGKGNSYHQTFSSNSRQRFKQILSP